MRFRRVYERFELLGILMLDHSLALRFKDSERGCLGRGQLKLKKVDCGARADSKDARALFYFCCSRVA
jgi:hypothetical protein